MPTSAPALWPLVHLCRLLHAEAERLHRDNPSSVTLTRLDEAARRLADAESALALVQLAP